MIVIVGVLLFFCASNLDAQQGSRWSGSGEVTPNSELERYLRVLQVAGHAPLYPWSIRGLSLSEVRRLAPGGTPHPWAVRYGFDRRDSGPWVEPTGLRIQTIYNSAFPFGANDGPVWAGRGLTGVLSGAVAGSYGPVSITVSPVAFWAQNASIPLVEHPVSGEFPYANSRWPNHIDLPQRFGDEALLRVDPGQSRLQLDVLGLAAGVSTANQVWGPGDEYPLVLGVNAPGFLHAFAGTARPLNLWLARIHGRVVWGELAQSDYSTVPSDSARRFMTGVAGVLSPRGIPGLEIGAARMVQMPWPDGAFDRDHFLSPIQTIFKRGLLDRQSGAELEATVLQNQIASIFARWVFPGSGLEVYGEFATEDHRHNLRDMILEPEQNSAYSLSLRKVWELERSRLLALRAEVVSAPPSHLARGRRQEAFYIHASTRQGHTNRGQVLGSPAAHGPGGSTVAIDLYRSDGRLTITWQRVIRGELGQYLETGERDRPDVMNSLGGELLLFRGRWDLMAGVTGAYNYNRNFERDAMNLNLVVGARAGI